MGVFSPAALAETLGSFLPNTVLANLSPFIAAPVQVPLSSFPGATYLSATNVTSNSNGLIGNLPTNGYILRLLIRNLNNVAVIATLGSSQGGSNVATGLSVPATGTLTVDVTSLSVNWFSASVATPIWLALSLWNGAMLNIRLDYEIGL